MVPCSSLALFAPTPTDLPSSLFEVSNQKAFWSGPTHLVLGADAHSAAFLACSADVRVVSAHAAPTVGNGAALMLADGPWTPFAATRGSFSGAVFILNCCATSEQGHRGSGPDETFSLPIAFIPAGASAVICTRWSVADEVAACFGLRLVELLNTGGDLSEVVVEGRRFLRESSADEIVEWLEDCHPIESQDVRSLMAEFGGSDLPFRDARHWAAFSLWL